MTPEKIQAMRERYIERIINGLFAGRKGHGNSVGVVYRVLRPAALGCIISDAYQRGVYDTLSRKGKKRR